MKISNYIKSFPLMVCLGLLGTSVLVGSAMAHGNHSDHGNHGDHGDHGNHGNHSDHGYNSDRDCPNGQCHGGPKFPECGLELSWPPASDPDHNNCHDLGFAISVDYSSCPDKLSVLVNNDCVRQDGCSEVKCEYFRKEVDPASSSDSDCEDAPSIQYDSASSSGPAGCVLKNLELKDGDAFKLKVTITPDGNPNNVSWLVSNCYSVSSGPSNSSVLSVVPCI